MNQENNKYFQRYRNNLTEIVEDDDHVRNSCKHVFPEKFVEGDTYSVPPTMYLVDCLVARILQLEDREATKPEGFLDPDDAWGDMKRLFDGSIHG